MFVKLIIARQRYRLWSGLKTERELNAALENPSLESLRYRHLANQ